MGLGRNFSICLTSKRKVHLLSLSKLSSCKMKTIFQIKAGESSFGKWSAVFLATSLLLFAPGCKSTQSTSKTNIANAPEEEQVDIGYGTVDRDKVVGSVATIDGDEAQDVQPVTLADMLRGKVAGVQVNEVAGGGIQVRIRGTRSFMGGNDPLYVVDDMAIQVPDGILYHINPRDVESISVLKDASATAIYGSRGANGVILIKTKRGGK